MPAPSTASCRIKRWRPGWSTSAAGRLDAGGHIAYRDSLSAVRLSDEPQPRSEPDEQALHEIFTLLRVRTGHDFTDYKGATILRRIERRLA